MQNFFADRPPLQSIYMYIYLINVWRKKTLVLVYMGGDWFRFRWQVIPPQRTHRLRGLTAAADQSPKKDGGLSNEPTQKTCAIVNKTVVGLRELALSWRAVNLYLNIINKHLEEKKTLFQVHNDSDSDDRTHRRKKAASWAMSQPKIMCDCIQNCALRLNSWDWHYHGRQALHGVPSSWARGRVHGPTLVWFVQ